MEIRNISDIENLILNQVEENIHLDYKAADALQKTDGKKKEISKDISAFANSDGGIVIYGVKEFTEPTKKYLPEKIDPIDRNLISKEWLEQVINSNVSPRIDGIKIIPISILTEKDKVVYVVEIPKSNTAHQAGDQRYYKRFNFESVAMYDYEIRDVMNRKKFPKIELSFEIEQYTYEVKSMFPTIPTFNFNQPQRQPEKVFKTLNTLTIHGHNIGGVYADYVNCFIEIPALMLEAKEYQHIDTFYKDNIEYKKIYCDNTIREIKEVTTLLNNTYPKYWPSRYDPILPDTNSRLKEIKLKSDINSFSGTIFWSINADNAPKTSGQIDFKEIEISTKQQTEEINEED
ncbi:MAG: ATP-binding protein [Bacteroidia bacterium]